jgi:hypothetical protein
MLQALHEQYLPEAYFRRDIALRDKRLSLKRAGAKAD